MYVLHNGRKAQIIEEKFGLVRIWYLDDLTKIWVNPSAVTKL
jgi:hypothetical protein